jgi:hypothetical protein
MLSVQTLCEWGVSDVALDLCHAHQARNEHFLGSGGGQNSRKPMKGVRPVLVQEDGAESITPAR